MITSPKVFLLGLGWIGSLVVVYLLGATNAFTKRSPVNAANIGTSTTRLASGAPRRAQPPPASRSGTAVAPPRVSVAPASFGTRAGRAGIASALTGIPIPPQAADASSEGFTFSPAALTATLQNPDPIQSTVAFAAIVQMLDASNIEEAVRALTDASNHHHNRHELALLIHKWGTLDGEAAMTYVSEKAKGWDKWRQSYHGLKGWATTDPETALTWAQENYEGTDNPYMIGIIAGIAGSDLDRATALALEMPYGRNRGRAVDDLIDSSMRDGLEPTLSWAADIPESKMKDGVITRVGHRYAKVDPAASADWQLDLVSKENQKSTVSSVLWSWSRHDPKAAAAWAGELSDPVLQREGVVTVAKSLAQHDPIVGADWLGDMNVSSPLRDPAYKAYAETLQRSDPESAIQWAGMIKDEAERDTAVQSIIRNWTRRNPSQAAEYIEQHN